MSPVHPKMQDKNKQKLTEKFPPKYSKKTCNNFSISSDQVDLKDCYF